MRFGHLAHKSFQGISIRLEKNFRTFLINFLSEAIAKLFGRHPGDACKMILFVMPAKKLLAKGVGIPGCPEPTGGLRIIIFLRFEAALWVQAINAGIRTGVGMNLPRIKKQ